jgi:hypothetical protein
MSGTKSDTRRQKQVKGHAAKIRLGARELLRRRERELKVNTSMCNACKHCSMPMIRVQEHSLPPNRRAFTVHRNICNRDLCRS